MDPKKNASNPTSNADGQVPLSAQDDGPAPSTTPPAPEGPEVTVDFTQGQEPAPSQTSQPGGPGNMPSITPESPAGSAANARDPFGVPPPQPMPGEPVPSNDFAAPAGNAPGQPAQPLQPQDPFAPSQSAQAQAPGTPGPQAPPAGAQPPLSGPGGPNPNPGAGGFNPGQQAVPPVAPVPTVKADKKTIFILGGVAVLLIIAILALVIL